MEVSPSVAGGSTRHFDVDGMLPLTLPRSWCATWFTLSRHGGLDVVGSFHSFFIVVHALRLLCVIFVIPISYSFPSVILTSQFVSRFYGAVEKGLAKYLLLYA